MDSTSVMVCGGYNDTITNQSELYDWRTNSWTTMPTMSTKKSALAVCRIERHNIIQEFMDEYDFSDPLPLFP